MTFTGTHIQQKSKKQVNIMLPNPNIDKATTYTGNPSRIFTRISIGSRFRTREWRKCTHSHDPSNESTRNLSVEHGVSTGSKWR
jgi:hypothetical protein